MSYPCFGRDNVYHAQRNIKRLLKLSEDRNGRGLAGRPHSPEAISLAKHYVSQMRWSKVLPAGYLNESDSWLAQSDAVFADLLLHPQDQGFTVCACGGYRSWSRRS